MKKFVLSNPVSRLRNRKRKVYGSRKRRPGRDSVTIYKRASLGKPLRSVARKYKVRRPFTVRVNPVSRKGILSNEMLTLAGGVIISGTVSDMVMRRFGTSLPGIGSSNALVSMGATAAYNAAIPILGAVLVHKVSKPLATGMVAQGLASAMGVLIAYAMNQVGNGNGNGGTNATGEYLNARTKATGAYLQRAPQAFAPQAMSGAFPQSAF